MTQPQNPDSRRSGTVAAPAAKGAKPNDAKTLLSTLRMTTTIGAVSLTLAGWGLLARAEAVRAAQDAGTATRSYSGTAATLAAADTTALAAPVAAALSAAPQTSATTAPEQGILAAAAATGGAQSNASNVQSPAAAQPTVTPSPAPTATSAPTVAAPTATPVVKFKLNVVNWVTTQAGDPVAVVQDNSGALWYVWGPDVTRIEQGLSPEYQPQPVNAVTRSRGS